MATPPPAKPPSRGSHWPMAVLCGLLVSFTVYAAITVVQVVNARPQSFIRDGLYPGGVFTGIDISGDADAPFRNADGTPAPQVALSIELQRYGAAPAIYYDRVTVSTAGSQRRPPVPPPGWGAAMQSNWNKSRNRVDFAAKGLAKADVDWLAVGRGETWSRTFIHWDELLAMTRLKALLSTIPGVFATFAFITGAAIRKEWRVGRYIGKCENCGYQIGVPDAERCPECGQGLVASSR